MRRLWRSMERKFMNSRSFLRRLNALESQFGETRESSARAVEIQELLRKQEELLESLRSDPDYSPELERQLVEEVVQDLIEYGLLQNAAPLDIEPNENGEGGE
jgi:hypothetical protein